MRRSAPLALVLALLLAPAAGADHHLMLVDEVAPGGAQADQFIELRDPFSESFPPFRQYSVAATDAAGAVLAQQVLTEPPPFEFRNSTAPFVLGGANVTQRNRALEFQIPPAAAKVCFYGGTNPVNCLSYGNLAIPAGQSAQRQSCGVAAAAAPTPGAANTETGACSGGQPNPGGGDTGGDGGGGTGGGGGGGESSDLTPPQQQLAGKRRQDVDRLAVAVTLSEPGTVTARGRVSLPGAARVVRFKTVKRSVDANTRVRLRLRLARKARRAVKAALHDGRRLKARVTIAALDTSGNLSTAKRAIRLTD
jgi:hypothetical protein